MGTEEAVMVSDSERAAARKALLLRNLPDDLCDALIDGASTMRFDRGATIFLQGEPATAIFVVLEGWVKLYRVKANGAEAVVGVFSRGGSFGEAPALMEGSLPVSAMAVTDCTLLMIRAAHVIEMMATQPAVTRAMMASILMHLHDLVGQIEQMKAQNGAQRVAEFLVSLAAVEKGACTVMLPYDKALMAARLGMKPESLSRAFSRLRAVGVAVPQNFAEIEDVAALRRFSEEDRTAAWNRPI